MCVKLRVKKINFLKLATIFYISMELKLLIPILLLVIVLPLVLISTIFSQSSNEKLSEKIKTSTTTIETKPSYNQTTQQPIYPTSQQFKLPEAKQYSPFEIINISEKNTSISLVYFEKVPSLQANLYEPLPNGTSVFHPNVTYFPKQNESIYLATFAYVIENITELPEGVCFRQHEHPATFSYCYVMGGFAIDMLSGFIQLGIQFGLKIFSSEEMRAQLIDEKNNSFDAIYHVYTDPVNVSYDGSWITQYKDYELVGSGEKIIGKGSYAFIIPRDSKPQYVYIYIEKTGLFSIFDPEKVKPIALVKVG
jgi:hypothetical protein